MYKKLIYDYPTRILHWYLAIGIVFAIILSKGFDDESIYFDYHKIIGLSLIVLLLLRMVLGVLGSHYSKFKSFNLSMLELVKYVKDTLNQKEQEYAGHNPGSSYAALLIYISTVGLILSGLGMSKIATKDIAEEIHEMFFVVLIISIALHLAGLIKNILSKNKSITLSMINGNKRLNQNNTIEIKPHLNLGLFILAILLFNAFFLFNSFDKSTRVLNTGFVQLKIGENESNFRGEEQDDDD